MTRNLTSAAALLAGLLQGAPALPGDLAQLAAGAGISEVEAQGMSLSEIHALKINRESRGQDRVTVSSREHPVFVADTHGQLVRAAGLDPAEARSLTLGEIAALKASRNSGHDAQVPLATAPSRPFDADAHPQLVAAAGLSMEAARGMTLGEIYRAKVNREARGQDRQ
jgi:hypothetical protein